jgi:hypothetical protein
MCVHDRDRHILDVACVGIARRSVIAALLQGVHGVIVSAVLGHASPAFTVAVYQHAWQEGPYEAAAALEKALGSSFLSGSGFSDVGNPLANDLVEAADKSVSIAN